MIEFPKNVPGRWTPTLEKWNRIYLRKSNDDTDKLASFLKANEADGVKSVHFFFPNKSDAGPQTANHIVVDLAGFSDGFSAFKKACAM